MLVNLSLFLWLFFISSHCLWCFALLGQSLCGFLFIYLAWDLLNLLNLRICDLSILENSQPLFLQMLPLLHSHYYFLLEMITSVRSHYSILHVSCIFSYPFVSCAIFCVISAAPSCSSLSSSTMSKLFDYSCYVLFNSIFHFWSSVFFPIPHNYFYQSHFSLMLQFMLIFLDISDSYFCSTYEVPGVKFCYCFCWLVSSCVV